MQIIKNIFFTLLALSLIACMGIFIFFQTFDTDQYLPQITKKASLVLGRPVSIGHVGLGLSSRGITLDAWPLIIADDSNFTTQPFIKIDRVRISLDFRTLILHQEIHITNILLQSPQIHFIRSEEGNINARSVGQAIRSGSDNIVLGSISRNDNSSPPQAVQTENKSISLFQSKELHTKIKRSPYFKSLRIQDAVISFIDQSQTLPLDIWLTNINASLNGFSLSKPFRLSFDASLYSDAPNVAGSALVFLDVSKRSVRISDLSLHADLPHLNGDQIQGISPGMPDSPIFKDIAGVVQLNMAHLEIGASGAFTANGNLIFTDGVIKNFNIIKAVLSHTPGAGVMDSYIDKLGADDTIINKAQVQFSIHDKTLFIDDSLIQTNILELIAKGSVDQGLNTDMQTMLHLNTNVSATLVNELGGLKYLMDDSNRIAMGASLKGVIPHLKYKPDKDFRKKSKKMLIEEGANILGALLGGGQTSVQGQDASSQDPGKKTKMNFKNILKNLL